MPYLLDLCPDEFKKAVKDGMPLMISTGSVEFHGGQLPLGTDLFITEGILKEIEKQLPVIIAPSITYCPTGHAVSGPEEGTIDVSVDCFINYCGQILKDYEHMGFKKIYVLLHHQGGYIESFLKTAIYKYSIYEVQNSLGDGWWTKNISPTVNGNIELVSAMLDTKFFGGHGGKGETEAMMAFRPETVCMDNIEKELYFWNITAFEANHENANKQKYILTEKWIEKIKTDMQI